MTIKRWRGKRCITRDNSREEKLDLTETNKTVYRGFVPVVKALLTNHDTTATTNNDADDIDDDGGFKDEKAILVNYNALLYWNLYVFATILYLYIFPTSLFNSLCCLNAG